MSGKTYLRNQTYFKPNYHEALKYLLPSYLYDDDITGTPKDDDVADVIINSHLDVASGLSSTIHVSAVEGTTYSSIDSLVGIAPFFVKQNELTNITTQEFESDILTYFNKTFNGFANPSSFESFTQETLLPAIKLNDPDSTYFSSIGDSSAIHNYLINKISWLYFLNTSGGSYAPSAYVQGLLVSSLYAGIPVKLNDGIKGLTEHVWRNASGDFYPSALFASGSASHLSGTQQLDKLQTWVDVIYSPLYADRSDFTVRDKFTTFLENSLKFTDKVESGPFARLIRALSFLAFDINNQTEEIASLYDLDDCPDDYLPLIAQLIGWDLFGSDANKWRLQLRNAVSIYKAIGTKKSIQASINTVFPKDKFPIESRITEMWESYVPYLIYYALATESDHFKSFESWNPGLATDMGVEGYSARDMDENIRLAVDRILLETIRQFPDSFPISTWLEETNSLFNYRGREYSIPPFEEYPYYVNVELSQPMIEFISDRLACFGVRQQFAVDVSSYVTSNALNVDDEPRASSWLIFTSGYNSPPNLDNLIRNLSDNRFDYASLWSGKSSHFKLVLNASEFDFTKKGLSDIDGGDAVTLVADAVRMTAPAHAIPLLSLEVSAEPDASRFDGNLLPLVYLESNEITAPSGLNSLASGLDFNSYKRGINPAGNVIGRSATQSLTSPEFLSASTAIHVPRNTSRRRNFEKVMPFNGYYDRTGFNMPVGLSMESSFSGISLGYVPSSCSFTPVSSYINLPAIWAQCEGLNSNNSYYEYNVSNTSPSRSSPATTVKPNLIIMAGQSNMNGRGVGAKEIITGVNYWNVETSSFSTVYDPNKNSYVSSVGGYSDNQWGPDAKFIELLSQKSNIDNIYILKYAVDNSFVVDTSYRQVGNLSTIPLTLTSDTYLTPLPSSTWCPSAVTAASGTTWAQFESHLDMVINSLGGSDNIANAYFIWNQGETEAGRGQDGDFIANQYREATELLMDTVKAKFGSSVNYRPLRVKINKYMASGSIPDWHYWPQGLFTASSVSAQDVFVDLYNALGYSVDASNAGSYGNWSWSSIETVRSAQDAMDSNPTSYGTLLNVDDIIPTSIDGNGPGLSAIPSSGTNYGTTTTSATYNYSPSVAGDYHLQNIHYVLDQVDTLGRRLFSTWANESGVLRELDPTVLKSDRGQLPGIYAAMHRIGENRKYLNAVLEIQANLSSLNEYLAELYFALPFHGPTAQGPGFFEQYAVILNEIERVEALLNGDYRSLVTSGTNAGTPGYTFPASHEDYYNFEFGRDLHRFYHEYKNNFRWHRLSPDVQEQDGANIFSHTFGPLLYNYDFEDLGPVVDLVATSFASPPKITVDSGPFTSTGSFVASSADSMYLDTYERVSSGIVDGVELVLTSGTEDDSSFSIIKVPGSQRAFYEDPFLFDKTLVIMRSGVGAATRVRFDVSKYAAVSPHPIATNFLSPDHEFKVTLNSVISRDSGTTLGGRGVNVWIHTKPESGMMWSFVAEGKWVQHDQSITRSDLLSKYAHYKLLTSKTNDPQSTTTSSTLECIDQAGTNRTSPVIGLGEDDFENFEVNFHTRNREIRVSKDYQASHGQLHRLNQNYVVEVFMTPGAQPDEFMLVDNVKVQDLTLKALSEIFAAGTLSDPLCQLSYLKYGCEEFRVELSKQDLFDILKHFNNISGKNAATGYASRDKTKTQTIMKFEGGSRVDYRHNESMVSKDLRSGTLLYNNITFTTSAT